MAYLSGIAWFELCRQALSTVCFLWLAARFGRSLHPNRMPLIEQIARVGTPILSPSLQRYVRRLTWLWCVYFVAVAFMIMAGVAWFPWVGVMIAFSSLVLFVGENKFRSYRYPDQTFPSLLTQIQHTWRVWREPPRSADFSTGRFK